MKTLRDDFDHNICVRNEDEECHQSSSKKIVVIDALNERER
jgi:hypothetical protein